MEQKNVDLRDLFEKKICGWALDCCALDTDEYRRVHMLTVEVDMKSNLLISAAIVTDDPNVYYKEIKIESAAKHTICCELLRILYLWKFIGKQSHIQDLKIIIEADQIPVLEFKMIGTQISETIFDKK